MVNHLVRLIIFMLITLCAGAAAYGQVTPCSDTPLSPDAVYKGVPARKNKKMNSGEVWCQGIPYVYGLSYQCVEYVRRFYAQALNYSPAKTTAWQGNANTFLGENVPKKTAAEVNAARGLVAFKNKGSTPPAPDDILVFNDPSNKYGHVAIITDVIDTGDHTHFTVKFIEQNWSLTGTFSLTMTKGSDGTYTVADRVANVRSNTIYTTEGWARLKTAGVQLGPALSSTCVNPAYTVTPFYRNSVTVNYKGGKVVLSSTPDGTGKISTDDEIKILVTHPDGTTAPLDLVFGYPRNSNGVDVFDPQDMTSLFKNGQNTVSITYIDNSQCSSSTAYYLVLSGSP